MNPRCEFVFSIFQESIETFENYLIIYQNKSLTVKGSNTLSFEDCYEKQLDVDLLPTLLIVLTGAVFSKGLDKSSFYNELTKQKLLGCTMLIPECVITFYYESGSETLRFGEQLSSMLRELLSYHPAPLQDKLI